MGFKQDLAQQSALATSTLENMAGYQFGVYKESEVYKKKSCVYFFDTYTQIYGFYVSLQDDNYGNHPPTATAWWSPFLLGGSMSGTPAAQRWHREEFRPTSVSPAYMRTLAYAPTQVEICFLSVNGSMQYYGVDYTISGKVLTIHNPKYSVTPSDYIDIKYMY